MSLKNKLIMLLFLPLSVSLAISFFAYEKLKTEIMSKTGSLFLRKQIQFNRERVLHPLMRELALAQKLANSPALIKWAENEKDPATKKKGIAELESFRRFFADKSYFFAICSSQNYYFNDSSDKFADKQLRYKLNPKDPENRWFFATLESKNDYLLNVDHDEKLGVTKVWINVVVKSNDKPLGIVGTGIDLSKFINNVIGSPQPGISNILIEQEGAIQVHNKLDKIDFRTISKSSVERKTIFSLLNSEKDKETFLKAMDETKKDNKEIPVFFSQINGRLHLVGLSYIKEIDWYNVSILDIGTVIGKNQFLPFAGFLIFNLIVFSIAIYVLLNKFIFKRIKRLDRFVRGFAEGALPDYSENLARDELGNLEEGFREMAKVVKAETEELETRVISRTKELGMKNEDLEKALVEIKELAGLLPICSHCKNIRDDKGYWHAVEAYIGEHSKAQFSHGICPDCLEKHYSEYSTKSK